MMKKKYRTISVDGCRYTWAVRALDPHYVSLRVWSANDRRRPWSQVRFRFDDPWLHYGELLTAHHAGLDELVAQHFVLAPITPDRVADVIRLRSARDDDHREFEFAAEALIPVEDAERAGPDPFASEP